jgi:hypothetical protein
MMPKKLKAKPSLLSATAILRRYSTVKRATVTTSTQSSHRCAVGERLGRVSMEKARREMKIRA